MQTIGTVQSYLELNQLSSYTSRDIGWITGVFTSLALFLGIQVGPILDAYGPRVLGPVGCAIYIPVFFVLAECHQYWHFMLVLGIWGGTGAGILSMVGVAVIGKWFVRRRGLAMGIALCGSSVGGVIMPLMLRQLLPSLGWAWSIRILAFLIAAVTIAGLFVSRSQHHFPHRSHHVSKLCHHILSALPSLKAVWKTRQNFPGRYDQETTDIGSCSAYKSLFRDARALKLPRRTDGRESP